MKAWVGILVGFLSGSVGFAGGMIFERKHGRKEQTEEKEKIGRSGVRVAYFDAEPEGIYEETVRRLGYSEEEFDPDETATAMEKVMKEMDASSEPDPSLPITMTDSDEWYSNDDDYVQMSLAYYAQDDILSDWDGARPKNLKELVGEEWIDYMASNDFETIYIRNPGKQTLIRIDRVEGSWSGIHGDEDDEN